MARQRLFLVSAGILLAFVLPLVAARPGGRLCHTSFFFPDPNNVRTVTVVGSFSGIPAGFKLSPVRSDGFFGSPASLLQVRFFNLHRQMRLDPAFPHHVDVLQEGISTDKSLLDQLARNQIAQTWSSSMSNPYRPLTWIDVHSRHNLWHPDDMIPHVEQMPLHSDEENRLWVCVIFLIIGVTLFLAAGGVVWFLLRTFSGCPHEEHDTSFLYGYQELPTSGESEKEAAQKEFAAKQAAT